MADWNRHVAGSAAGRIGWAASAISLLLLASSSCAASPPPAQVERQKASSENTQREEPAAEPATASSEPASPIPPAEPKPEKPDRNDATTIVIESGESVRPSTVGLVEASRAEKERRAKPSRPAMVITNKTLSQYNKGKVTFAEPRDKAKGASESSESPASLGADYWQQRGLGVRQRWHDNAEQVLELEQTAADLRRRFYAENDPRVRDLQIKPDWDRALDQLRAARAAVDAARKDLSQFLDEGRAAGAMPGWLREGTELEPPSEPIAPAPTDSIEPPIFKID
jgi:hypothetical protein